MKDILKIIGWIILITLAIIGFLALCIYFFPDLEANEINPPATDEQIANAIYKAENSAKYPYGIKSLKYENRDNKQLTREEWARKICLNTIRNNRKRFANQNKYANFIEFLASRYAPINAIDDPKGLNHHWIKNVKYFLKKQ